MSKDDYESMKGNPIIFDSEAIQQIEKLLRKELSGLTSEQIKELFLGDP